MSFAVVGLGRIRWGLFAPCALALSVLLALAIQLAGAPAPAAPAASSGAADVPVSPKLARMASASPAAPVEVIVQFERGTSAAEAKRLVWRLEGRVTGELHIFNGLVARMAAAKAYALAKRAPVHAVSLNAPVKPRAMDVSQLLTSYNESVRTIGAWKAGFTGRGVGVGVIDTGIAGDLADFRSSQTDARSRVVGSAVTNPYAKNAGDSFGHGTHVAGIIAGDATNRAASDPLYGDYIGVAPEAELVSIKASDEQGNSTVLDVIYGIQFAVDHKDEFNLRVLNLSLESSQAQSYKTDPLDAAVESAWFSGIVVVAAAGNRGTATDAVRYAPGNDPYVISVGAVDDRGTKTTLDDALASWSSRGTTQDGIAKPEIVAPGARIVSNLAPKSAFAAMCPSCVVAGQYIRAGGTSMSAPMVAGAAAVMLQAYPQLTPNQVKGAIVATARKTLNGGNEVSVVSLVQNPPIAQVNQGLTPNSLVDPATGAIDYTRSSWSRSSWSGAAGTLRSSWSRSSWSCNCSRTASGAIDPSRSSWSRSSWSSTTAWNK